MDMNIRCKKHPKQRQSPGVCSACLRERLSQLSTRNNKITATTSSFSSSLSSSSMYSSVSSSPSSPSHYRVGSTSMKGRPISFLIKGEDGLIRSKSVAFISSSRTKTIDDLSIGLESRNKKKKKSGFWSRLLNGSNGKRRNMKEVVMQSKSIKETQVRHMNMMKV
ncbi:hypothetical protein ACHQM5_023472 [Ranunculus cassubicifolius]